MRVLVTGASGFIGGRICKALRSSDNDVIAVDPKFSSHINRHGLASEECYGESFDAVFHFGGMTEVDKCENNPIQAWEANVVESVKLARSITVKSLFVYANTVAAMKPESNVYGHTKNEADYLLSKVGIPYSSVTLPNIYGLGGSGVISKLIFNKSPVIYGDGEQEREFAYVDDIVDFLVNIVSISDSRRWRIGGHRASINAIAKLIGRKDIKKVAKRDYELDISPYIDSNFHPPTKIKDGIHKMIKEAEEQGITHYAVL